MSAPQRLSEQLREAIEEEVATGRLKPGTHLDEQELAERFGVSRTPIRETLSLLAGEGLVEIRRGAARWWPRCRPSVWWRCSR
jgi:DNA-binding GntR family transcriptional regulator